MQLYAVDKQGNIVSAQHAEKKQNYSCLECQSIVRRRGGLHRQDHFYHVDSTRICRQQGKSLVHLQVQQYIKEQLGDKVYLEFPMKDIHRIADVYWEPQKIVFEVQCSFITAEEIAARNRDYASIGIQVVWILHTLRFGKRRSTAAEVFLIDHPHYFTNINEMGKGKIFDQFSIIKWGMRYRAQKKFNIDIAKCQKIDCHDLGLQILQHRMQLWPIRFSGDCFDANEKDISEAKEFEIQKKKRPQRSLKDKILMPYYVVFQSILERSCK